MPIDVEFAEGAVQRFNCGPSSCGAYGTTAGLAEALRRFGTLELADVTAAPARAAREGVEVVEMQAFLLGILGPIVRSTPEVAALYEPDGRPRRAGERFAQPELADLLERLGREGPGFLYSGDVAAAVSDWVLERGGLLTRADLEAYEVIERPPARGQLPWPPGAHQPAALLGRDPDRGRARAAGTAGPAGRHAGAGRGHRLHQPGARRGVPGRA